MEIKFEKRPVLKEKPQGPLGFGKYYTDYMFVADYDEDQGGFHDARIIPFGPIEMDPASMVHAVLALVGICSPFRCSLQPVGCDRRYFCISRPVDMGSA